MSFWESLGKLAGSAAGAAANGIQDKYEHVQRFKDRNDHLSDEDLIKKFKYSTGDEKFACGLLLKERGYGNDN